MFSELILRFSKKQNATHKLRAADEKLSSITPAERFLDDGLQTSTTGNKYLDQVRDRDASIGQLYRQPPLSQSFDTAPTYTLRYLCREL